jgi:hypothetical protein
MDHRSDENGKGQGQRSGRHEKALRGVLRAFVGILGVKVSRDRVSG